MGRKLLAAWSGIEAEHPDATAYGRRRDDWHCRVPA
jgi:hypothetical protein